MLPIIPIVAAVTTAAILFRRKRKSVARINSTTQLLDYIKSFHVRVDSEGKFDPDTILPNGMPLLFEVMSQPQLLDTLLACGANPNICNAEGTPALIYASHLNNPEEIVPLLLKHGANPNAMDAASKTAIFYYSTLNLLRQLETAGAIVNAADTTGKTALFYASTIGAQALIEIGIDVNARDMDGKTVIFYTESRQILEILKEAGADFDAVDNDGKPALFYSFTKFNSTHASITKDLLECGANPNAKDRDGKTAIFHCYSEANLDLLKNAKADFNATDNEGKTALFYSFDKHSTKLLIERGTDPNAKDNDGKTAIFFAKSRSDIQTLIECGANINARDNTGKTALFYSFKHGITKDLIDYLLNFNARDNDGKSALFYATSEHDIEILRNAGANFNVIDKYGRTALFYSFTSGTTKALLSCGCNAKQIDNEGKTALFYLPAPGDFSIIELLDDYGIDIDAVDNTGNKFRFYNEYIAFEKNKKSLQRHYHNLYDAVESNDIVEVRRLIREGANLNSVQKNKPGWNMIHVAVRNNNPEMIEVLARAGVNINYRNGGISPLEQAVYNQKEKCFRKLLELGANPKFAVRAVKYSSTTNIKKIFKEFYHGKL